MPENDLGEKTEQPTDRRRAEARQKGNVPRSVDLNSAGLMLATAACIALLGLPIAQSMAQLMKLFLGGPGWLTIDRVFVLQQSWDIASLLAGSILPLMLAMMAAALLLNLVQVGFLLSPEVLHLKFERLNPIEGAKRLLSVRALVKLGVSLGKLIVVVVIAVWFVSCVLPNFLQMTEAEPASIFLQIHKSMVSLAFQLALALMVLALIDFTFQKWKYEQDLKMSKQEVREEMKNMEGDPLIRQRRREAHRKFTQARELEQVKHADVVITNPTEIAVALKYDPQRMAAPTVVAKGMHEIAARIRQIAAEHGVPIIERKPLARALYRDVKVGQQIPGEMYEVFVEIMAYVYHLSGRTPTNLK